MAVKFARISCAGCGELFRWRSLERLAARLKNHCCWNPATKPFKTHADTFGHPDPDWRPDHA